MVAYWRHKVSVSFQEEWKQAYNLKQLMQKEISSSHTGLRTSMGTRDMLYVIMEQCKNAEKEDNFVQDVTCAPEFFAPHNS